MTDTERAFACSLSGCTMSFTNENQLTVHMKKHDMMLNLGSSSKSAGFVADQTPTPTRFIRNCEEVGLFQDLQNVNPFEETFRRAVESGNTGTLSVSEVTSEKKKQKSLIQQFPTWEAQTKKQFSKRVYIIISINNIKGIKGGITDDTLHTPHIFPHIVDVLSGSNQILSEGSVQECTSSISITEKDTNESTIIDTEVCTSVKLARTEEQDLLKNKVDGVKNGTLVENIINQVTSTQIIPRVLDEQVGPQLSINGEEVQLLLKTADGKLMQLSAVPVCEPLNTCVAQTSLKQQQTVVIKTEPPLQYAAKVDPKKPSPLSLAKMRLKQVLIKTAGSQNDKSNDSSTNRESEASKKENQDKQPIIDQVKKKEILERNRASSMRARAKRKAWIQQLERTVSNVNETNVALQMEIKVLRAEVAKLKTILLAHKDCPVTKAIQKGNGIILGQKVISLNTDLTANSNNPLGMSVKRSTGFPASEVPIVPKKKLSLAPTKNPIIFPKVDCTANLTIPSATLIKTVPTLKIMGVGQLLTEKEETKQILIVQNPPRKVENATRQIIQINPNYEVDHGPKTAGT